MQGHPVGAGVMGVAAAAGDCGHGREELQMTWAFFFLPPASPPQGKSDGLGAWEMKPAVAEQGVH